MISEETIKKIAELARLELKPEEVSLYSKQLGSILEYVSELSKVKTEGIEPMVTPSPITPHVREDETRPSLGGELSTSNAPDKAGNLFKVPAVL